MSPSRPKRPATKAAPKKAVTRKPKPAARKAAKAKSPASKKAAKPVQANAAGKASAAPAHPERSHCVATDPFGDPCQSAPRRPSKYCTIHSYLDR